MPNQNELLISIRLTIFNHRKWWTNAEKKQEIFHPNSFSSCELEKITLTHSMDFESLSRSHITSHHRIYSIFILCIDFSSVFLSIYVHFVMRFPTLQSSIFREDFLVKTFSCLLVTFFFFFFFFPIYVRNVR